MKTDTPRGLDIDRIAFFGRTYTQYRDMFGLDDAVLEMGRILDCPGGASSFALEAFRKGFDVTACDLFYDQSAVALFEKGKKDISHVFEKFDEVSYLYVWDYYHNKEEVMKLRNKSLDLFVEDFCGCSSEGRYIAAALPRLPFPAGIFSLVLSANFLFLYGDRLDLNSHKACLKELMRICSGELRIFPHVGLDAKPYRYLDEILTFLDAEEIEAEIVKVPLEFQQGANRMMKLSRRKIVQESGHEE